MSVPAIEIVTADGRIRRASRDENEDLFWAVCERVQRTTETVEILRRAWTGRRFSFEGRSFRYERVRVTPPASQPGGRI